MGSKFKKVAKATEDKTESTDLKLNQKVVPTKKAPAKKKSAKEDKSERIQTYLTPSEMKQLENSLKPREAVSAWVRDAILEKLKKSS